MTNTSAIGYMILATEDLGLDYKVIKELEYLMKDKMDFYTEEEAEEAYRRF